eukprot:11165123-Lingulodinium_polyedra.AAC.1
MPSQLALGGIGGAQKRALPAARKRPDGSGHEVSVSAWQAAVPSVPELPGEGVRQVNVAEFARAPHSQDGVAIS